MRRTLIVVGAAFTGLLAACHQPAFHAKPFLFVDVHGENPRGHIVQAERPTTCWDETQPTVVDCDQAHTPVWSCIAACKPGQEPITYATATPSSTRLAARCEPVCASGTHRRAYVEVGPSGEQHCEQGAPPPTELKAMAMEQQKLQSVHDAREETDYVSAEAKIRALDKIERWDGDALTAYRSASIAVDDFGRRWDEKEATEKLRGELHIFEKPYAKAAARAKS